jgi:hypothetical protein
VTAPVPTPIGVGAAFHPPALSREVVVGAPVGGFRCGADGTRFGVHLELFAAGRVVVVPAGIGVAPPGGATAPTSARAAARIRPGRASRPA